jgi:hypothetical protein
MPACPEYILGVANNMRVTRGQHLYILSVPSGY